VDAMVSAVERVLDDPEPYRERGLRQASAFTWERCAREHEAMYEELLA
jgi:glycosyltransferase involved in cell wall biosynthesis